MCFVNAFANILSRYNAAISLKIWLGTPGVVDLLFAPVVLGGIGLLFGVAWFYGSRAFGKERLPSGSWMSGNYFRDALFIGLGGAAGLVGLERLLSAASAQWPTLHRSTAAAFGQDYDASLPVASILGWSLLHGLLITGLVVAVACFLAAHVKVPGLRLILLLAGSLSLIWLGWCHPASLPPTYSPPILTLR